MHGQQQNLLEQGASLLAGAQMVIQHRARHHLPDALLPMVQSDAWASTCGRMLAALVQYLVNRAHRKCVHEICCHMTCKRLHARLKHGA